MSEGAAVSGGKGHRPYPGERFLLRGTWRRGMEWWRVRGAVEGAERRG